MIGFLYSDVNVCSPLNAGQAAAAPWELLLQFVKLNVFMKLVGNRPMLHRKTVILIVLVVVAGGYFAFSDDRGNQRFFKDQTYHHLTMRALGQTPYGGADTGEILETIKHIESGDAESWFEAWYATAERVRLMGENLEDPVSRGRAFLRAHNYYRTAEFLLDQNDRRRKVTWAKNTLSFYAGLDALGVVYQKITIDYESGHINALYFPGDTAAREIGRRPLIIACGGVDSTMEELYFAIAAGALERGYPVLLYEGPGQGAVLREQNMYFTPAWERPTKAVIDRYYEMYGPPPNIVLVGMSMGGYLAPRAAAFDDRIGGVVALDVLFDVGEALRSQSHFTFIATWLHRVGMSALADRLIELQMKVSPSLSWGVRNTQWVTGVDSLSEVPGAFDAYTLVDVASQIRSHVLILAGSEDHLVPLHQVEQFKKSLINAKSVETVIYDSESGGKEHCQDGAVTLWHGTFFDWLSRNFDP